MASLRLGKYVYEHNIASRWPCSVAWRCWRAREGAPQARVAGLQQLAEEGVPSSRLEGLLRGVRAPDEQQQQREAAVPPQLLPRLQIPHLPMSSADWHGLHTSSTPHL